MEGFCRGCFIKYDEPTELLQYTEKNRRLFVYTTNIQVKRNDSFSFQLCKNCYINMKIASQFKKLCRTTDKKYKNYLALKDVGDSVDICTYLKNNDDALTIRFPMINGNSTPPNQLNRDDDNESNCTSIRNFMTDIMQGTEMPDSEARIIREVIEEEADVLDDTLDSHWLQDDASIDTDLRLDFSFSPLSTPRSIQNDHCYTPKTLDQKQDDNNDFDYYKTNDFIGGNIIENDINEDKTIRLNDNDDVLFDDYFEENNDILDIDTNLKLPQDYCVLKDFEEPVQIELREGKSKVLPENFIAKCTIDRNLEAALKDECNKEFCLDDLLISPQVFGGQSASSTPSLSNILFGNKLDADTCDLDKQDLDQYIENDTKDIDIIEEIFKESAVLKFDKNEIKKEYEFSSKFDVDNSVCLICEKKFKEPKALRIHAAKSHSIKIPNLQKKVYRYKLKVCDVCGQEFRDSSRFAKHKKRHNENSTAHKCDRCAMIFSSASKLEMHMITHTGKVTLKNTGKVYVCDTCGAISHHYDNHRRHTMRHNKSYVKECQECGKKFVRSSEWTNHMRKHTGERPFKCEYCIKAFTRRDALVRHVKLHTDEKRFQCDYCDNRFVTKRNLKLHIQNTKECLKLRENLAQKSEMNAKINVIYAVGSQEAIEKKIESLQCELKEKMEETI